MRLDRRPLATWKWGDGPAVLLVHGWGGQAAQFSSFVAPLVERGYAVVAFDGPGHGRSGRMKSSLPQLAWAARAVSDRVGRISGVVGHSLGAAAVALAMRDGLRADRVAFLAPVADPIAWIPAAAAQLGFGPRVVDRVWARTERRLSVRLEDLNVRAAAADLRAPLLVIHDRDDGEVPLGDGIAIAAAWPGARLIETTGLGHNRILRDPGVIAQSTAFLAGEDGMSSDDPLST